MANDNLKVNLSAPEEHAYVNNDVDKGVYNDEFVLDEKAERAFHQCKDPLCSSNCHKSWVDGARWQRREIAKRQSTPHSSESSDEQKANRSRNTMAQGTACYKEVNSEAAQRVRASDTSQGNRFGAELRESPPSAVAPTRELDKKELSKKACDSTNRFFADVEKYTQAEWFARKWGYEAGYKACMRDLAVTLTTESENGFSLEQMRISKLKDGIESYSHDSRDGLVKVYEGRIRELESENERLSSELGSSASRNLWLHEQNQKYRAALEMIIACSNFPGYECVEAKIARRALEGGE